MLKRTGASVGWQIAGLLTFGLCLEAFAGTGGLLGEVDGTKPSHWGSCVRIPPDTGKFVVKDRAMTIHRKRPGAKRIPPIGIQASPRNSRGKPFPTPSTTAPCNEQKRSSNEANGVDAKMLRKKVFFARTQIPCHSAGGKLHPPPSRNSHTPTTDRTYANRTQLPPSRVLRSQPDTPSSRSTTSVPSPHPNSPTPARLAAHSQTAAGR